ncbi:MAG: DegT/DnrJ/EryC1/StrS family aminotransferase [Ilumatobacter sp.]|uniref:DegT/DnrJ/EryC1/StrS family aminotransferase n=1 Tax=Ilumatobacter sp. TaxID=1967498 RepID=UPI0026105D55|nr:DegT/DnrJ/EryC1/StrS family aminotransferase [Ilumatobacter sp.]MDJ0768347.1 DegT/DnrJ/EryC1/StrS family aminotransferase [Ilumatobacter sp.]
MITLSAPHISDAERDSVLRVLDSGMLAQGPEVAAFEAEFAARIEAEHAVAVNSGTSALHLGLMAAGVEPGQEVIVPSFTFAATANAVRLAGAEPVFVDIELDTFCMSAEAAAAACTDRTAAVMPVHLYGHPADMDAFGRLCDRRGLLLVEDAAQAHLATWNDRFVGTFGLGMFSFYPTKNMTSGEGGMITTSDAELARAARLLRNQGMERRYENEIVGFNCRMTDLHAAIGRAQLARLDEWTSRRRDIAARYDRELTSVVTPCVAPAARHVYHQYTVRVLERRDAFVDHLHENGVGAGVYYPTPVHRLPSFGLDVDLPVTEAAASQVVSIPVHPRLTDDEVSRVIEVVNAWS